MDTADLNASAADVADDELFVSLLGGFSVAVGPRTIAPTAWRLRKAGHLVKLLALAPQYRMHREQVLDTLWPHLDPNSAGNNLRVTLHFARKLLNPDPPTGAGALQLRGEILLLYPDRRIVLDVERFETAAQVALGSDDPSACETALDRYGGELLPEDRFEDWAIERRESLRAVYLALLHQLAQIWERRGRHDQAIETLRRLLREDPAGEPAHVALMRLYALSGQRPSALRQYQQLREVLQRDLDIEPAAETTRLYEAILTGSFDAKAISDRQTATGSGAATPARSAPPRETQDAPATNLPVQLTSFVGRVRERSRLETALANGRLVTLIGPGGGGKTRLAIEVARSQLASFRDGVWLADLTGLTDPALVPQTVAVAVQVQEADGRPPLDALTEALTGKDLLLVLDNCEHLIDAAAELADCLLRRCPQLRILATSREALRVPGEVVWPVPALAVPDRQRTLALAELRDIDAVRLFVERARLNTPDLDVTDENGAAIATICQQLDGIPLAIELAAARVGTLSLAQIASRLDNALRLLTTGTRTGPPHHRSLRATIEWSYGLLSDPERRLLRRLAVFSGGFTLNAAEAICVDDAAPPDEILDLLSRLVDQSLIVVSELDGEVRYRLLETIRQFSAEHLEEDGSDAEPLRRRHALYFLELSEEAEPRLLGPEQRAWQARLTHEHDNLRAALRWFDQQHDPAGLRMAGSLYMYWWYHGFLDEGLAICEALLRSAPVDAPARDRAMTLATAGLLASWQGRHETAAGHLAASLRLWETLTDQRGAALCYLTLGVSAVDQGDYERAEQMLATGLELARTHQEDAFGAMILDSLSNLAVYRGDVPQALRHSEESARLAHRAGDLGTFAHSLINLAEVRMRLGDLRGSLADARRGLTLARELGEKRPISNALNLLGRLSIARGEYAAAIAYGRESIALARSVNDVMGLIYAISATAHATGAGGDPIGATRLLAGVAAARETLGVPMRAVDHERFDPLLETWRESLGETTYIATWAAGQLLSLDQAAAEALASRTP